MTRGPEWWKHKIISSEIILKLLIILSVLIFQGTKNILVNPILTWYNRDLAAYITIKCIKYLIKYIAT